MFFLRKKKVYFFRRKKLKIINKTFNIHINTYFYTKSLYFFFKEGVICDSSLMPFFHLELKRKKSTCIADADACRAEILLACKQNSLPPIKKENLLNISSLDLGNKVFTLRSSLLRILRTKDQ